MSLENEADIAFSQVFSGLWRAATGEQARSCVDSRFYETYMKGLKADTDEQIRKGKINSASLELRNQIYMGLREFPNFPHEPSPEVVKKN